MLCQVRTRVVANQVWISMQLRYPGPTLRPTNVHYDLCHRIQIDNVIVKTDVRRLVVSWMKLCIRRSARNMSETNFSDNFPLLGFAAILWCTLRAIDVWQASVFVLMIGADLNVVPEHVADPFLTHCLCGDNCPTTKIYVDDDRHRRHRRHR